MSSNKDQFKGNNQNSNSTEQENDPLNDSTKLLKQISKKGPSQHPQNFSENSWPKQIQRHSLDFAKHNYDQNLNPMNCEQNKLSENQFNFGIQGSFSNLQTVENQDEQIKIEFQNQQSHKQSEAFTQATPTNSQNQTLIHQKDIQPSQRYENRLFSTEQDDYQPNNNQLNPNDSFNTGFAHFGGSNQAEENYQNIDNSFRECHFGQSSKNDQIYSEPEFGNNALNLNKQNERTKSQNQEIISLSSKSSYCFKIASDSNSPNVNNSFSKKQAQEINHDYTLQKGCSNRNLVNNSFNNNFNNEDEQQEEVVDVEAANNQFNTSFSQIPLADQNQILGQSENRQSFTCENQVNISFEGGFGCQNQEKAANEQETIQYQQGEREKNYQQQEEQQQGISFVNQSFG